MVTHLTQAELEAALAEGGTVLFGTNGTLTLTNTITIALDSTLDANGNAVTISGASTVRLFQVSSNVAFLVKNLVLADGRVVGTNGLNTDPLTPGQDVFGAGFLNQGTLTLIDCTLSNNVLQGGSAGQNLFTQSSAKGGNASGGAIYNGGGTLNLTNCSILQSEAIAGSGSVGNTFFGAGGQSSGGAIHSEGGSLNLEGVLISGNSAIGGPPGATSNGSGGLGGSALGGAVFVSNGPLLLHNSIVSSNKVLGGASLPIGAEFGPGVGSGLGGAVFLSQDSRATVQLSSFLSNSAAGGDGAGRGNYPGGAGQGGAVYNAGTLQVSGCTFSAGATIGGVGGQALSQGGAICSTKLLVINSSTFLSNEAMGGVGGFSGGAGTGEGGALWSSGPLYMTNLTFTANVTLPGFNLGSFGTGYSGPPASGGAVRVAGGTAYLVNVTIASNSAQGTNSPQGGGLSTTNTTVLVRNSIIANSPTGGDVWGTVTDAGYNICSDGTANFSATGSLQHADPLLSALSNNGGPTATMPPLVGSPARDAIPSGFPPIDQRGVSRPQGPAADIGAVEADFIAAAPAIVNQPLDQTVRAGTNVTLAVGASGTAPLAYQWSKDSHPVDGATTASLSLLNVQAAQAGTYSVVVTNAYGSAASQGATLVVDSTPLILTQPTSVVVAPGAATSFDVAADGPSLSYQWWHNGSMVPGGTAAMLNISSALGGAQGDYYVVVSNFAGMATSTFATLTFDALSILVPPKDTTVETGYPATFSILVSGIAPFAYQWEFNGKPIPGATGSTYTIGAATTNYAGNYNVIVTNAYKSLSSPTALLSLTPGAVPPLLVPGRFGQSLTITFTGEAGRTYRLFSSTDLSGWLPIATNTPISAGTLQFVQPITTGPRVFYRVVTP
jgi:hypothetical protein